MCAGTPPAPVGGMAVDSGARAMGDSPATPAQQSYTDTTKSISSCTFSPSVGADEVSVCGEAANAVSRLQEYVQSCSSFSPHTKILTWSFEQQLENETALLFQATVSFMFNRIPHYFCGDWQSSKKKAQRDTAERVKHYLAHTYESVAVSNAYTAPAAMYTDHHIYAEQDAAVHPGFLPERVVRELWAVFEGRSAFLGGTGGATSSVLKWDSEERERPDGSIETRATVTFCIDTVPHHFAGGWCSNVEATHVDTADRVLWYFGKRAEAFIPTERPQKSSMPGSRFAAAPWMRMVAALPSNSGGAVAVSPSGSGGVGTGSMTPAGARSAVEDKTVLMQVQNALQKDLAKETPPGQRVWVWSYEPDPLDPQMFRAQVGVPGWNRTFQGEWCRGKKLAQRSACLVVKIALELRTGGSI